MSPKETKPDKAIPGAEKTRDGLAQLVLTLIALIRDLAENQVMRRMENNTLTDDEVEKLGQHFQLLNEEIDKLKDHFGFSDSDLDLALGPLGSLRGESPHASSEASLGELLDRIITNGLVVLGDVTISLADIDLLKARLALVLSPVDKLQETPNDSISV